MIQENIVSSAYIRTFLAGLLLLAAVDLTRGEGGTLPTLVFLLDFSFGVGTLALL